MLRQIGLWGVDRQERTLAVLLALEKMNADVSVLQLLEQAETWETVGDDSDSVLAFRQRALPNCSYADFPDTEESAIVVLNGQLDEVNARFPGLAFRVVVQEPASSLSDRRLIWLAEPEVDLAVSVLRPLLSLGLNSAHITTLEPVSSRGSGAVASMIREVVSLLNAKGALHELGDCQYAFNMIPLAEDVAQRSRDAIQVRLDNYALVLDVRRMYVPVFYGLTMQLHLCFSAAVRLTEVRKRVQEQCRNAVVMEIGEKGLVELLAENEGMEPALFIDLQQGNNHNMMNIMMVVDNLRYSIAQNLLEVLRNLHQRKAL